MAETIGLAIIAAASSATGTTIAVTTATASFIGQVAITTALVGGSLLVQSNNQTKQRNETQQSILNEAMGVRRYVYGRTLTGGSRYFLETKNGALIQGVVIAAREIDRIEAYYIGDRKAVTTLGEEGGTVTDFPQTNKVSFEPHYGTDDQLASPTLLSQFPGSWTADHRLRGLANVVIVFLPVKREEQQIVYPQGYATPMRFLVRGAKVWDPTNAGQDPDDKTTWAWSENASDCICDYLRWSDGMRFPVRKIDASSFEDMHSLCAEPVQRKDGTTEARYRLGGVVALNEAPKDVLARMLSTCDGTLVRGRTGLIGIRGGRYRSPLINIPTERIITADLTQGNDLLEAYNLLKISYSEPDAFYQPTEIRSRENKTSQAQIGIKDQTLDLAMVPSYTQAARLGNIRFERDNPQWKGSIQTDLSALNAINQEAVSITFDPLGDADVGAIMDADCNVSAFNIDGEVTTCNIGFSSISASAYAWDPNTDEPPRPAIPNFPAPINVVPTPSNIAVSPSRRVVAGGATAFWAILSWNAEARTDLTPQAQYRPVGGAEADWQPMSIRADGTSAEAGPLTDGVDYEFRPRWVAGYTPSNWPLPVTLRATADATPPGPPTGFVVNGGAGKATGAFTSPNSPNFGSVAIYRSSTNNFANAVVISTLYGSPGQARDFSDDGRAAGSWTYWARALNLSGYGDASSTTGPITIQVT